MFKNIFYNYVMKRLLEFKLCIVIMFYKFCLNSKSYLSI